MVLLPICIGLMVLRDGNVRPRDSQYQIGIGSKNRVAVGMLLNDSRH